MSNQIQDVVSYCKKNKAGITRYVAAEELGVMNLWARVSEAEELGAVFTRTVERGLNRYGKTVKWTRYKLVKAGKNFAKRG